MKILFKKTNFKKVGFSTMASFMAKILSWRFRQLNIVGCLLKRRPTKGGHGHPKTPLATPLYFLGSGKRTIGDFSSKQLLYDPSEELCRLSRVLSTEASDNCMAQIVQRPNIVHTLKHAYLEWCLIWQVFFKQQLCHPLSFNFCHCYVFRQNVGYFFLAKCLKLSANNFLQLC